MLLAKFYVALQTGNSSPGRGLRQEMMDMVAARDWLVEQQIAQPDAIFLNGASYGGYLTLWGLAAGPLN